MGACLRRGVRFSRLLWVPLGSQWLRGRDLLGSSQGCSAQCVVCAGLSREDLQAPVPQLLQELSSASCPLAHLELLPRTVCDTHCALSVAPLIVQKELVPVYFLPFLDRGFHSFFLYFFLPFCFSSSLVPSFPSFLLCQV